MPTADKPETSKPRTAKPRTTKRATARAKKPSDRRLGIALLSAGAAALGLGATIAALLLNRRSGLPAGTVAPDLAADAAEPGTDRAPEHFRPDPTAVPSSDEREALRPATGSAPTLSADRGSVPGETQGAA